MHNLDVDILPIAEECLDRIHAYIAQDSIYYADLLKAEIIHIAYDVLAHNPFAGKSTEKNPDIREIVCPNSRYIIRYSVNNNCINIRSIYRSRGM
jgi:plasmid stabilization system protein ParE